ncbi:cysteine dioxygenase [Emticicia sp. BO119]|uniref:cysteine dioxygenase family protein n=1 Tax=Emticicia sp. BO119 TaxID=2757768 RepID=UPI0015EFE626|nr:cysteine dioxygenase [Emticicia sp. BO119]MBA4850572.1 cysteine dioxygenase [Emticicia sp. BO119]
MSQTLNSAKLGNFITSFTELIDSNPSEVNVLTNGVGILQDLVAADDWLPEEYARPHPQYYQQFLLHLDPQERFSVVSFVWGPGQITPIHNHTVWGLIGMLRGAEYSQSYALTPQGTLQADGEPIKLEPGKVEAVSPYIGDIHQVRNAFDDKVSVSIHVYGANIGKVSRSVLYEDGTKKDFVSGYSTITNK